MVTPNCFYQSSLWLVFLQLEVWLTLLCMIFAVAVVIKLFINLSLIITVDRNGTKTYASIDICFHSLGEMMRNGKNFEVYLST